MCPIFDASSQSDFAKYEKVAQFQVVFLTLLPKITVVFLHSFETLFFVIRNVTTSKYTFVATFKILKVITFYQEGYSGAHNKLDDCCFS